MRSAYGVDKFVRYGGFVRLVCAYMRFMSALATLRVHVRSTHYSPCLIRDSLAIYGVLHNILGVSTNSGPDVGRPITRITV